MPIITTAQPTVRHRERTPEQQAQWDVAREMVEAALAVDDDSYLALQDISPEDVTLWQRLFRAVAAEEYDRVARTRVSDDGGTLFFRLKPAEAPVETRKRKRKGETETDA